MRTTLAYKDVHCVWNSDLPLWSSYLCILRSHTFHRFLFLLLTQCWGLDLQLSRPLFQFSSLCIMPAATVLVDAHTGTIDRGKKEPREGDPVGGPNVDMVSYESLKRRIEGWEMVNIRSVMKLINKPPPPTPETTREPPSFVCLPSRETARA